jgi:hypothetical protein
MGVIKNYPLNSFIEQLGFLVHHINLNQANALINPLDQGWGHQEKGELGGGGG